jgi:hypothetical protein
MRPGSTSSIPITVEVANVPRYAQNQGRSQRPALPKRTAPATVTVTTVPTSARRSLIATQRNVYPRTCGGGW